MDFIATLAGNFNRLYFRGHISKHEEIIDAAQTQLYKINAKYDKIKFLNILLEGNNTAYDKHKPQCTAPNTCPTNFAHESITYFLVQELDELGV